MQHWFQADEVCEACITDDTPDLTPFMTQLSAIHAAPSWLWPALVTRLVAEGWTAEVKRP